LATQHKRRKRKFIMWKTWKDTARKKIRWRKRDGPKMRAILVL